MATEPLETAGELPALPVEVSRRITFAIVAVALFMSSVDSTVVATALPTIHRSLHATINWAGWTITVYSLGMIVALPIAGKVSDQFGRRRVFLYGVALFTVASAACGLANGIYLLILFRALQAIGGGALMPSASGLISDHFGTDRDRALGLFGTISSTGQIVGPVIGGILVGYFSWRWVFYVNIPVGFLLFSGIVRYIPESPLAARTKIDLKGLGLMASCVLLLSFAITSLGGRHTAVDAPVIVVPLLAAVVLAYLFVRHAKRVDEPFIPMRLLRAKGFAVMNTINVLWGGAGFGIMSLAPLYAEYRYHLVALNAGTLLSARGVTAIGAGALAVLTLRRTGYRPPLVAGFAVVALGDLVLSLSPKWGFSPYLWLALGAAITGIGSGTASPAARNACLQFAPEEVAAISGIRQMFVYLGLILAVSTDTAILNRSAHPGLAQAHILWVVAGLIFLVLIPLVFRVPEHKGAW